MEVHFKESERLSIKLADGDSGSKQFLHSKVVAENRMGITGELGELL